jgi:hypothetical protein
LLLFNKVDELSYGDIKKFSGINEKELKLSLLSLSVSKVKILKRKGIFILNSIQNQII